MGSNPIGPAKAGLVLTVSTQGRGPCSRGSNPRPGTRIRWRLTTLNGGTLPIVGLGFDAYQGVAQREERRPRKPEDAGSNSAALTSHREVASLSPQNETKEASRCA